MAKKATKKTARKRSTASPPDPEQVDAMKPQPGSLLDRPGDGPPEEEPVVDVSEPVDEPVIQPDDGDEPEPEGTDEGVPDLRALIADAVREALAGNQASDEPIVDEPDEDPALANLIAMRESLDVDDENPKMVALIDAQIEAMKQTHQTLRAAQRRSSDEALASRFASHPDVFGTGTPNRTQADNRRQVKRQMEVLRAGNRVAGLHVTDDVLFNQAVSIVAPPSTQQRSKPAAQPATKQTRTIPPDSSRSAPELPAGKDKATRAVADKLRQFGYFVPPVVPSEDRTL